MKYYGAAPYTTLDQSNQYIGDIGLFHYQEKHLRVEIGFKLGMDYWNRGIMSECIRQTLAYGFGIRKYNRIKGIIENGEGYIMTKHRIYTTSVASVYPHYVTKAERKGRTKAEVDEIIRWLTGYSHEELEALLEKQTDFETFFAEAPQLNPSRDLIKGVVCGVRVEDIEEPTMQEIRYLDKLIDELAKGKAMEKILRK